MTLIGQVFPKLLTVKDLVRLLSKNARLKRPFQKQHAMRSGLRHCLNLNSGTFYIFIDQYE